MVPGYRQSGLKIFSTCPPSNKQDVDRYAVLVADVARWSEEAGCHGILIYTDNGLVDPWLLAQIIIQNTTQLRPLVAVQPVYMHPYYVAKMVTTLGNLHSRQVLLNMVAGGFRSDLLALDDSTPHDRRYDRLVEYTTIVKLLIESATAVSYDGEFYRVERLKLHPRLSPELRPGVLVSGSSEAGWVAARTLGATAIRYPRQNEEEPQQAETDIGFRVGIIARQDEEEAWKAAHERFPGDRKGQITHQMAMKVSDSVWHKQLSETVDRRGDERSPYWLFPFENYKTFCPYLVGTYDRIATELAKYMALGARTFILDVPSDREDLRHIRLAFDRALGDEA